MDKIQVAYEWSKLGMRKIHVCVKEKLAIPIEGKFARIHNKILRDKGRRRHEQN